MRRVTSQGLVVLALLLPALPSNANIDTTQRILFSQDFGTFLTGSPSVRDFHLTTPAEEVTDLQELARGLAEHPLDLTEQYFPTKLVTDIQQGAAPQIKGFVVHPAGLTARPIVTLLAGNGLLAGRTLPPEFNVVVAPGYEHLDVLTAAPVQNSGRPEIVSSNLARFAAAR